MINKKHSSVLKKLVGILDKVEKPSRYIGNEYNAIKKDAEISMCLIFPDLYDVGMSHFGVKILYDIVNKTNFAKCERSYLPWPDMQQAMNDNDIPLYSYETYTPINEFDVIGFTLQYEMSYSNVLRSLRLGNIPVEIMRGCTNGCRFCQAGMIYRPIRERSAEDIFEISKEIIRKTGYEELSLLSLSSADHSQIEEATSMLKGIKDTSLSIPSTRANAFTVEIAKAIGTIRKSGITIAPEAGTQRLRDVINKGISEEDIFSAARMARDNGWNKIKLYFMIGLPTETDEDVKAIGEMLDKIKRLGFHEISATIGVFVPKAHTPFQFDAQIMPDEAFRRFKLLNWTRRFAKLSFTDPYKALIEGVLSRGVPEI